MAHTTVTLGNGSVISKFVMKADRSIASLLPGGKYYISPGYSYSGVMNSLITIPNVSYQLSLTSTGNNESKLGISSATIDNGNGQGAIRFFYIDPSNDSLSTHSLTLYTGTYIYFRSFSHFGQDLFISNYHDQTVGATGNRVIIGRRTDLVGGYTALETLQGPDTGTDVPEYLRVSRSDNMVVNNNGIGINATVGPNGITSGKKQFYRSFKISVSGNTVNKTEGTVEQISNYSGVNYMNGLSTNFEYIAKSLNDYSNDFYGVTVWNKSNNGPFNGLALTKTTVDPTTLIQTIETQDIYSQVVPTHMAYIDNSSKIVPLGNDHVALYFFMDNAPILIFSLDAGVWTLVHAIAVDGWTDGVISYGEGTELLAVRRPSADIYLTHFSDIINSITSTEQLIYNSTTAGLFNGVTAIMSSGPGYGLVAGRYNSGGAPDEGTKARVLRLTPAI